MRWSIYAMVILLLLPVTAYAVWDFQAERQILDTRAKLAAEVDAKASAGLDHEVIQSAAAYLALKPRNPSREMGQHVLELYRASLWRWLLKDPRATLERTQVELATFEASENALSQVRDE